MAPITNQSSLADVLDDFDEAIRTVRSESNGGSWLGNDEVDRIFSDLAGRLRSHHKDAQSRLSNEYLSLSRTPKASWDALPITGLKTLLFALQLDRHAAVEQRDLLARCLDQWRVEIGLWEDGPKFEGKEVGGKDSVWDCRALRQYSGREKVPDAVPSVAGKGQKRKRPFDDRGSSPRSNKKPAFSVRVPAFVRPKPKRRPAPHRERLSSLPALTEDAFSNASPISEVSGAVPTLRSILPLIPPPHIPPPQSPEAPPSARGKGPPKEPPPAREEVAASTSAPIEPPAPKPVVEGRQAAAEPARASSKSQEARQEPPAPRPKPNPGSTPLGLPLEATEANSRSRIPDDDWTSAFKALDASLNEAISTLDLVRVSLPSVAPLSTYLPPTYPPGFCLPTPSVLVKAPITGAGSIALSLMSTGSRGWQPKPQPHPIQESESTPPPRGQASPAAPQGARAAQRGPRVTIPPLPSQYPMFAGSSKMPFSSQISPALSAPPPPIVRPAQWPVGAAQQHRPLSLNLTNPQAVRNSLVGRPQPGPVPPAPKQSVSTASGSSQPATSSATTTEWTPELANRVLMMWPVMKSEERGKLQAHLQTAGVWSRAADALTRRGYYLNSTPAAPGGGRSPATVTLPVLGGPTQGQGPVPSGSGTPRAMASGAGLSKAGTADSPARSQSAGVPEPPAKPQLTSSRESSVKSQPSEARPGEARAARKVDDRVVSALLAELVQKPRVAADLVNKVLEWGVHDAERTKRLIEAVAQPLKADRTGLWRMRDVCFMQLLGWQVSVDPNDVSSPKALNGKAIAILARAMFDAPQPVTKLINLVSEAGLGAAQGRYHLEAVGEPVEQDGTKLGMWRMRPKMRERLPSDFVASIKAPVKQEGAGAETAARTRPRPNDVAYASSAGQVTSQIEVPSGSGVRTRPSSPGKSMPPPPSSSKSQEKAPAPPDAQPTTKIQASLGVASPQRVDLPPHPADPSQPITDDEVRQILRLRLPAKEFSLYWKPRLGTGKNNYKRVLRILRRVGGQVGPGNIMYLEEGAEAQSSEDSLSTTPTTSFAPTPDLTVAPRLRPPESSTSSAPASGSASSSHLETIRRAAPRTANAAAKLLRLAIPPRELPENQRGPIILDNDDASAGATPAPSRPLAVSELSRDGRGWLVKYGRMDSIRAMNDRMEPMRTFVEFKSRRDMKP